MRVFVLFMLILLIICMAVFISFNHGHRIGIVSLGLTIIPDATLNVLMVWAFGLGMFWTLIIACVQEIRLRAKISKFKHTIDQLENELGQLRTIPLADLDIKKEGK
ncbi:hypothetical protein J7L68_06700 [bacterium]|nr:hypothetical protein [bacterium]